MAKIGANMVLCRMNDKRKFRRFQLDIPSSLIKDDLASPPIPVTVIDASFGGIGFVSAENFPAGTLITLSWDRPPFASDLKVNFKCRILNSRRNPSYPNKIAFNTAYQDPDPDLVQKLLHWAQMQSLIQAKASSRTSASSKTRGNFFF